MCTTKTENSENYIIVNKCFAQDLIASVEKRCKERCFKDVEAIEEAIKCELEEKQLSEASNATLKGCRIWVGSTSQEARYVKWYGVWGSKNYPNNSRCTYAKLLHTGNGWELEEIWRDYTSCDRWIGLTKLLQKIKYKQRTRELTRESLREHKAVRDLYKKGILWMRQSLKITANLEEGFCAFLDAYGIRHSIRFSDDISIYENNDFFTRKKEKHCLVLGRRVRAALKRRNPLLGDQKTIYLNLNLNLPKP